MGGSTHQTMTPAIATAIATLRSELRDVEQRFAEAIQLLESASVAYTAGDRAEASKLVTAACDIEHELGLDGEATGGLFEELGLDDGAEDCLDTDV